MESNISLFSCMKLGISKEASQVKGLLTKLYRGKINSDPSSANAAVGELSQPRSLADTDEENRMDRSSITSQCICNMLEPDIGWWIGNKERRLRKEWLIVVCVEGPPRAFAVALELHGRGSTAMKGFFFILCYGRFE